MSDIFSQLFPEPTAHTHPSIVTMDTPYLEDDALKKQQKAENIALIKAYSENLTLYRELEQKGEGAQKY